MVELYSNIPDQKQIVFTDRIIQLGYLGGNDSSMSFGRTF
ncbi:hypothetical protein LEP1GSC016_1899 [Leptospira borgpetersenii serovar Hardjo-bovis str. Sponselee]|uniref:Uncharacterized protein n=1 Tax=Leptospira borgpetersenii serovar Hardjo-bovis str. Sponselee TaxID=1303729 RepID=M6C6X2_LEPBO|nr:hypothetical protein LEP1GSC016_1899 [Leptospira borgpetersenii serovar Hardjo-bovis str. Sponselee]